jgi:S-DNA-T family DNA segregation ATPase FtsK/SpoIIIE
LLDPKSLTVFAMSALSVTDVRLGFECPRLLYLTHHYGGSGMFLPADSSLGIGSQFHQIADRCVTQLKCDPAIAALFQSDHLAPDDLAQRLQQQLYKTVFFPHLQTVQAQTPAKVAKLYPLWQGLQGLIRHWAEWLVRNRRHCGPQTVVSKTFLGQELSVSHTFTLPNGQTQQINGRCDSLMYDFTAQRLCVVEYKTYTAPDPTAQAVQVALYGLMLRETIGVSVNSAVYSVLPDWQEHAYTWEQLETTLNQLLPTKLMQIQEWLRWQPGQPNPPPATIYPDLCNCCPQYNRCQTTFSPNPEAVQPEPDQPEPDQPEPDQPPTTPPPTTPPPTTPPAPTNNAVAEQLVEAVQSFGVGVESQGVAVGPGFIRVRLKPNLGVKVNSLLKLSDDLRVQLALTAPPMIAPQAGFVSVDLPRPDRQVAQFDHYIQPGTSDPAAPVHIALGVTLENTLYEADLSDPNTCHFLVGGTTGSGKSEFLRSLLLSLIRRHAPAHLKIALVDPKRVTFPEFETMPWLLQPIVKEAEAAIELMDQLVVEMDRRYRQFEQVRVSDLSRYNASQPQPLPRIVCIFDEYADFMAEKAIATELESSIKRLGAMARAAGIHLIVATQRPEARVVTPLIRSNLPGRVALRTASDADSMLILGGKHGEAVNLLGKGDLLHLRGAQLLRLQSLFAPKIVL